MYLCRNFVFSLAAALLTQSIALAGLITFEPDLNGKLPNGELATDDMAISNQFAPTFGITFGIDNDSNGVPDAIFPILERMDSTRL